MSIFEFRRVLWDSKKEGAGRSGDWADAFVNREISGSRCEKWGGGFGHDEFSAGWARSRFQQDGVERAAQCVEPCGESGRSGRLSDGRDPRNHGGAVYSVCSEPSDADGDCLSSGQCASGSALSLGRIGRDEAFLQDCVCAAGFSGLASGGFVGVAGVSSGSGVPSFGFLSASDRDLGWVRWFCWVCPIRPRSSR